MNDRLEEYRDRRDFRRTTEPSGDDVPSAEGGQRFVIHHHLASSEHYDLRLEIDDVLVSWAVPKGPSTDPREKRLAIHTENHPIDYLDFEGMIPEDEYGGGSVIVWDIGRWQNLTTGEDGEEAVSPGEAVRTGHLSFCLEGDKLAGGYTLQRFRDDDDEWLLIKRDDDHADARRRPTSTEPESVLSGHSVDEVSEMAVADEDDPEGGEGGEDGENGR